MTATELRAPMPWFGGKRLAAPIVWDLLGDPLRYLEPFAGSAAVLLARPPVPKRRWELINDLDGWLVNMWRAVRADPAAVAAHAAGPMTEVDYHARSAWLKDRAGDGLVSWLEGDPAVFDAKAAAWWLYVCAAAIGTPLCDGPWRVVDGRLVDTRGLPHAAGGQGITRELPHAAHGRGITRGLPYASGGQGQLEEWFSLLATRLQWVTITARDWSQLLSSVVVGTSGVRAIFFDPPYHHSGDVYSHHRGASGEVADQVRQWCIDADPALRIVLAGYDTDHDELLGHGWTKRESRPTTGYGRGGDDAGKREQLWASPACIGQGVLL